VIANIIPRTNTLTDGCGTSRSGLDVNAPFHRKMGTCVCAVHVRIHCRSRSTAPASDSVIGLTVEAVPEEVIAPRAESHGVPVKTIRSGRTASFAIE